MIIVIAALNGCGHIMAHSSDQHKKTKHSETSEKQITRMNLPYLFHARPSSFPYLFCTSVLPLFHDPTLKRWRLTSQHNFFPSSFKLSVIFFLGHDLYIKTSPSASSELVIKFLGHDLYQDLDCSLVLRLISRTQPFNIPHTIKNSKL